MAKVERHPHDSEKYQSTFDSYGHGKGNGKSRNAVYKHHKKFLKLQDEKTDFVKKEEKSEPEISQNQQEIPIWEEPISQNQQEEFEDWGSVEWDSEEEGEVIPNTIPNPIRAMNSEESALDFESTKRMSRFGFILLDKLISKWGQGVMNNPEWVLKRSPSDYDALEQSTVAVMNHYGIRIPVSPLLVFGATVSAAYIPPLNYVRKNADPNRKRRGIFSRLNPFNRKKKNTQNQLNVEGELNETEP